MTVQDIVDFALTTIGRLGPGRSAGAAESGWAFKVLNGMVDSWKSERLFVYVTTRTLFNIVANQQVYTIGPSGADFTAERPERIELAGYIFQTSTPKIEQPLVILSYQEWAALSPKALTSTIPYFLYYEPYVPLGKISIYPVPTLNSQIALYLWKQLDEFAALTDTVIVAPAYREALEYNLAVRLAPMFPGTAVLDPMTLQLARDAIGKVKTINLANSMLLMQTDAAARGTSDQGGHYNILTNRWT